MAKKGRWISPMEEDESVLEERPKAEGEATRQVLGKRERSGASGVRAGPDRQGPMPAVGLRSAVTQPASPEAAERLREKRDAVRAAREKRRQEVWDKLDAARRSADERLERLRSFVPRRGDDLPPAPTPGIAPEPLPEEDFDLADEDFEDL